MPLPYEFNGACSIELFRSEDLGWNPNKLSVTAGDAALNILLPLRSGLEWSKKWLICIVPHAAVDKEVRLR